MKKFLFATATMGLALSALPAAAQAQRQVPSAQVPSIVQTVQSNDSFKVIELEDRIRELNGRVEELNFLLLQMQEKLRKLEEDNESRFQELEEKESSLDDGKETAEADGGDPRLEKPDASGVAKTPDVKEAVSNQTIAITRNSLGTPPRALGTLTFDDKGNVIDNKGDQPAILPESPFGKGSDGAIEASEFGATPNEVFLAGKSFYDSRQFTKAAQAFGAHTKAWPKDPRGGEARFYWGESLFWQKAYYQAAEIHLDTHNNFPEAATAAENLLGLGLSLAGLNQREVACATYAEVLKQYPEKEPILGERIKDEQAAAKC